MPAGMEVEQMPPDLILAPGAERCRIRAMPGLGAPPHRAVVRIRTAVTVAEEPALSERGLHALPDRRGLKQCPWQKTAEADQAGVERLGTIRDDMRAHGRVYAIGADQEVAFSAGAVGEVRDNGLIGAIFDADKPFLEEQLDALAPGLVDNRLVQRGAAHVHGGLAETLQHVAVDRAEPGSALRMEIE